MDSFYRYWGKARADTQDGPQYHLLPYHCLDVAAVAASWWEESPTIRRVSCVAFGHSVQDETLISQLRAWILFFTALHDFGKFDVRFQMKASDAMRQCWPDLNFQDVDSAPQVVQKYAHGKAGYGWFVKEYKMLLGLETSNDDLLDSWRPWMAAVTGHHGVIPSNSMINTLNAEDYVIRHDVNSRRDWFRALEELFLTPVGLSLRNMPPPCSEAAQVWLAGFCSVVDWLGSNADVFHYVTKPVSLESYFDQVVNRGIAKTIIESSGLVQLPQAYLGVHAILPPRCNPQQVQTLVDGLPVLPGLTLIEAPTGSGKTEAALAYAWRLLSAGYADSIVFALPTQATANAMLDRLIEFSGKLFPSGATNVVLAHGKRDYNPHFINLKTASQAQTSQGKEEAWVQCAEWLAQSRKRVFLGQIGVCTVDQILLSVLPIKHKFVRGFGINKSVLIVDEVHAYDRYMYGLLNAVLARQQAAGGSAILLSATLPYEQRRDLLKAWDVDAGVPPEAAYPLITHSSQHDVKTFTLPPDKQPTQRVVEMECLSTAKSEPDDVLIARILAAAEGGARVAIVCNLVDVVQTLARQLKQNASVPVEVFHARYRFVDRQDKEQAVLKLYGKDTKRDGGRILVATQVVEQSLDLDFDWMITQICPVDLLFQRLGRLHRHERERPKNCAVPRCTVLISDNGDYGFHKLIYGNTRILWRTEQLLRQTPKGEIIFPGAYRTWIESVYERDEWANEPEHIMLEYEAFRAVENEKNDYAKRLVNEDMTPFADEDSKVTVLTRDSERSLNVIPVVSTSRGEALLDGTMLSNIEEWQKKEQLNLNTVSVPNSWRKFLPPPEDGSVFLCFEEREGGVWQAVSNGQKLIYSKEYGLEKT